jgi:hypothetical protein
MVVKHLVAFTTAVLAMSAVTASAQQCLHGADEAPEQAARRREAITAARTVHNIQANRGSGPRYFRHDELAAAPYAQTMKTSTSETILRISLDPLGDILPGWKLTLDVSREGYWFMIKDRTDPCGFAFVSTQEGLIYTAQPLR